MANVQGEEDAAVAQVGEETQGVFEAVGLHPRGAVAGAVAGCGCSHGGIVARHPPGGNVTRAGRGEAPSGSSG